MRRLLIGRRGRLIRRALFSALMTLGLVGGLELSARLLLAEDLDAARAPPPAPANGAPTMRGNPYLLWEYAPGERFELGVPVRINSLGLRGPEPARPKPAGVRRLLATGDSSIYGYGVDEGAPFIEIAAERLGVEGWNAAIPGYSTLQTINLLRMRALALEPDVLVIGNLWSDNNFDTFVDAELMNRYRLRRWLYRLALFEVLDYRLRIANGDAADARAVGWTVGGGPTSGRRRVALNDYAANLDEIVALGRDAGAEAIFVALCNRDDLAPREGPAAWEPYREALRATAARNGAPLVEVLPRFEASGLSPDALFLDEMHPTEAGHRIIGEALAEALAGWAEGEPLGDGPSGQPRPRYVDPFEGKVPDAPEPN